MSRLVAYHLVLLVAPIIGFVVGWIASLPLRALREIHEAVPELLETIIEGAVAILVAIAVFRQVGLAPNVDLILLLLLAFGYNDWKRQKRADTMVAAHWALVQKPDFDAAKAIASRSPIDAAGWSRLQKWERVRAWGHRTGIVVAGIVALIQRGPSV